MKHPKYFMNVKIKKRFFTFNRVCVKIKIQTLTPPFPTQNHILHQITPANSSQQLRIKYQDTVYHGH